MFFILYSDCQASAVRTFMSLSLKHVQLPRYLRLAPLSPPQLFVYFSYRQLSLFSSLSTLMYITLVLIAFYIHIALKLPGLPNLVRQKNNVISEILSRSSPVPCVACHSEK